MNDHENNPAAETPLARRLRNLHLIKGDWDLRGEVDAGIGVDAADLLTAQAGQITRMRAVVDAAVDWYVLGELTLGTSVTIAMEREFDAAGDRLEAAVIAYKEFPVKKGQADV